MLSKPFLIGLAMSISLNIGLAYLTYSLHSKVVLAEDKVEQLLDSNKALKEEIDKEEEACVVTTDTTVEYIKDSESIDKQKESVVEKIDSIPTKTNAKNVSPPPKQEETSNEDDYVDIDGSLPSDFAGLLYESYHGTTN